MGLSAQQTAMLQALIEFSPQTTRELWDRRSTDGTYPIPHNPAGVAQRLERRGLVRGQRALGLTHWSITDAGLKAMGWTR